jgi:hypothetical protein
MTEKCRDKTRIALTLFFGELRKFGRPRIIEQLRGVPRSVEQPRENARPSFSPRISVSFATLAGFNTATVLLF